MIIVKLMGGLGNQMFQYATGLSLAHSHHTELLIDPSFLNTDTKGSYTQRRLELDCFALDLKLASNEEIKHFNVSGANKLKRVLQRTFPGAYRYLYVAENTFEYQQGFENYPTNTYLSGFWQSERYFKKIKPLLLNTFTPKALPTTENAEWIAKMQHTESVSLHIRRGDYISNKNALAHHGICDLPYYYRALEHIKRTHPKIDVFVFSDDLPWCKNHLQLRDNVHFVDSNQTAHLYYDMVLMNHCKHNIIANSSFSWWGAWLNRNPGKIVVAPLNWFADKTINTADLIPSEWIRL